MLAIRMLGLMELQEGDRSLPRPPTLKSQSLLAYLLVHRRQAHPRERLAGLFWGDRPEEKAHHSLATSLWHIRRCIGEGVLQSDLHTVQIDPQASLWLDIETFASQAHSPDLNVLQRAIDLYRGEFLDGFYDDWVISERYRFEGIYLECLASLMAGREAQGEFAQALDAAQRLLACDPLREDGHRLAMRAYCHLGQRNAAFEQYHRCRDVVRDELNTDPMPETTALYESIRTGRFAAGPAALVGPVKQLRPPAPAVNPFDDIVRARLAGRDQEMARLNARWEEAKAGRGKPVLVRGEAGLGKTRLAAELAQRAVWKGGLVLWGHCFEFERILPYQPVTEVLRAVLPALEPAELERLPDGLLREVGRLAPELGGLAAGPSAANVRPGSGSDQDNLYDGVVRFLQALAERRPLLVVLEDLHWASEPTLEMVHHLARKLAGRPVLLLVTFRPEAQGPEHTLSTMARRLVREGLAEGITLAPLSAAAVEALVSEMSGRGEVVQPLARRIYRETEGNPFFLFELVKALFEADSIRMSNGAWQGDFVQASMARLPLPASLGETILARSRRVSLHTQEALSIAAVLGREFDFDLLAAVWAQGEEPALTAIEELLRHRLIQEGTGALGRDYAFSHHKIQEVIYASLSQRRRQSVHAQVAAAMETANTTDSTALAGELAFHYEQGRGRDPALASKALHYLWLAGDQARILYAVQEAVDYYQRALAVANEMVDEEAAAHTLLRLGQTQHSGFNFDAARQAYDEAFIRWHRAGAAMAGGQGPAPAPHPLRLLWVHYPATFDPILGDAGITHHVFSGLVEESPEMEVIPDGAWRWEMLDGGRRYVFHLRPDAVWTDGTPVTAGDYEFAWKRVLGQQASPAARFLYDIESAQALHQGRTGDAAQVGVRALDERTLEVTLAEPAAYFLHLMALPVAFPIPRHVVERWDGAWMQPEHIASNGAFRLQSWQADDRIVLVRNPGYRGRFTGNLREVHLVLNPEARRDWRAARELYEANEIDSWMLANMPQEALEEVDRKHRAERKLNRIYYTFSFSFDVTRPPFDDVRVRQAFIMALDMKRLAMEQRKEHWIIDQGGWIPAGMPGHTPGIAMPFDPERARQFLAEAGYPGGRGFPAVHYRSFAALETYQTMPAAVTEWRKVLGVDVTFELTDRSTYFSDLAADPSPMFGMAWWGNYPDPDDSLRMAMKQVSRFTHWQNADFDQWVENARHVLDPAARLKLYRQADALLMQEASVAPLFYPQVPMLVKPWVKHYDIPPTQGERGWKAIVIRED